jgi:hypothetical protein
MKGSIYAYKNPGTGRWVYVGSTQTGDNLKRHRWHASSKVQRIDRWLQTFSRARKPLPIHICYCGHRRYFRWTDLSIAVANQLEAIKAEAIPYLVAACVESVPSLRVVSVQSLSRIASSQGNILRVILFELNDQYFAVLGLSRSLQPPLETPDWVTDATGAATIYDAFGNVVAGPLAFAYTGGPVTTKDGNVVLDGNYLAELPNSFNPVDGDVYLVKITLTSTAGGVYHIEDKVKVCTRRARD